MRKLEKYRKIVNENYYIGLEMKSLLIILKTFIWHFRILLTNRCFGFLAGFELKGRYREVGSIFNIDQFYGKKCFDYVNCSSHDQKVY